MIMWIRHSGANKSPVEHRVGPVQIPSTKTTPLGTLNWKPRLHGTTFTLFSDIIGTKMSYFHPEWACATFIQERLVLET